MSILVSTAHRLTEIGREFHRRGWVFGTSGNFSAVVEQSPLRLAITRSGLDKGALTPEDILVIDARGDVLEGTGRPSAETRVHLAIIETLPDAWSCLHTHSVWTNLLGDLCAAQGAVALEGQEMLKGLSGVTTHHHVERLPILENSQDYDQLGGEVERVLRAHPRAHGLILRRHGLYTWGRDLEEARRHVEVLEYLFEVAVRGRALGIAP